MRQIRGWKLLLLLPRLLSSKPLGGGTIGKDKLVKRFQMFANGQWQELFRFGVQCAEELGNARRRHRRRVTDSEAKRGERAFMLAQLGGLSSARQALEGAELAAGNLETIEALRRRLAQFRDPLPDSIVHHAPVSGFELDDARFRAQSEDSPQRRCSWPFRHDQRTSQTSAGEPPNTAMVFPIGRTVSAESCDRSCAHGAYDSFEETGWGGPRHCGW